ncbi:MAG: M20/M25/M40 family metallo-hydrolase [Chloroflexota bacterium]|nr:M20/M25/M40 family metallo-hydrolase [Chloroflexota bacterium]
MANRERLVESLISLIRIDSPTGEEDEMDREVTARLQNLGFTVKHDAYGNVIARLEGTGEAVILSAHLDTVEPGRGIRPRLEGDILRSDGTTILGGDCKAGVAIVLEALTSVVESGSPHLPVEVVFSRAEEGGLNGSRNLDFSLISATRGVVFDGEGAVNRITSAAPAQNVIKAEITGRASHAGLEPEKGLSALVVAGHILTRLPLGRIDDETTSNVGYLEGGLKRNIVPERAFLDGEIRSRDQQKLDRLTDQFRQVFAEVGEMYPDARVDLDISNTYRAYRVDAEHPAAVMVSQALGQIGLQPQFAGSGGGSDANVFFEHGIAALPVGIGVRSFHTREETALIPEVLQGAEMCQRLITAV